MTVEHTWRGGSVTVEIRSPFAPDALMDRIRAVTRSEGWSKGAAREDLRFHGILVGRSVTVRLATLPKWRYAWYAFGPVIGVGPAYGPEFMGMIEADPGGSVLRGRIRLDHMTRGMGWFIVIYMGCALAVIIPLSLIPAFRGPGAAIDRGPVAALGYLALMALEVAALWALFMLPLWLWHRRLQEALQSVAQGGPGVAAAQTR